MSFEDDDLQLSASTLAALMEFQKEEETRKEEFEKLAQNADDKFNEIAEKGMGLFQEDWQLSQFWYSDKTADILADALLEGADEETVICIVSAPSVYAAIKKRDPKSLPTKEIYLFEFDKRFEVLAGDHFVFYDYNKPLEFRDDLKGKVNRLLADPPFLQEDCQGKTSQTSHSLLSSDKIGKTKNGALKYRLISCTGERMKYIIKKVYPDTKITTFLPEHSNGLSNEFFCYATFESKDWTFQEQQV